MQVFTSGESIEPADFAEVVPLLPKDNNRSAFRGFENKAKQALVLIGSELVQESAGNNV